MDRFIKSTVGGLVIANIVGFVLLRILYLTCGGDAGDWLGVNIWHFHVWTILTHTIMHVSALDLIFNLLWLWLFSRIALEFASDRQLLICYVIGGICGALVFIAAAALRLCGGTLFGASAAILAIIAFAAVRVPYLRLNLMFFGTVSVKVIALVAIGISLISFVTGNIGGGFAHLGGIIGGAIYALALRHRKSFRLIKPNEKKSLDELLDKVKRSGYSSLTASERQQLLDYSKRL